MKVKIIFIGVMMTHFFLVDAQEKTFRYFGGGSIGFDYSNTQASTSSVSNLNNKSITFSGSPILGYFTNDKIAVGLSSEYCINNTSYPSSPIFNSTTKNYSVSTLIRYYFSPGFFCQGQFIIGKLISTVGATDFSRQTYSVTQDYSQLGVGIGLGYDYKIAEKVFIEPMLKYDSSKSINTAGGNDVYRSNLFFSIGIITKI
jgi:Autotransporter beta-domain